MSGNNEIKFIRNGKEVVFKLNEKAKNKLKKEDKNALKPLFEAIVNSDGKKEISENEMNMLEKLKTIFEKTGTNKNSVLDAEDIKLGAEYTDAKKKDSNLTIGTFLDKKLAEIETAEAAKKNAQNKDVDKDKKNEEKKVEEKQVEEKKPEVKEEKKQPVITQADKNKQFNSAIQNSAKKYDKNTLNFTKEVPYVKGKYLTHIAKEALQSEGIQKPTQRQIWDRLAQIAVANDIKDVNNVPESKYPLKVGTGKITPIAPNGDPNRGNSPVANRGTGTVPVQTPKGGLSVSKDTDLKDWTEATAPTPEGLDLQSGTLKAYYKGEGENADIKFTYTKDGVTFEAIDEEELKTKIETFNNGIKELTEAPENETAEAKQARIQGALDKIMSLGNESAVKFAQQKLAENKANVTVDYYAEKTIAMLKSGNVALIEEMLGSYGANFTDLVNNNPEVQKAVGEVVKYLKDKFDNDEYLTLDEQKIKAILDNCVNADGVSIEAKAAVAEVKDEQGNVTTPAQAEVFAKTMVTDNEGNSYYKATLGGEGAFKDVEFRAKDDKVLDAFLAELKVADTDEKKTALFKKYAEMENADTELIKSMVKNASTFKADADTVIALVNKSNLDVIYAMDTSHFVDTEQNAETGVTGAKDKTNVQNAIKARIEAIMADPTLAKLPENAKYLDKIKGIEIPAESTAVNKNTDVSEWGDPTTKKYILENDAWKEVTDNTSDAVEVETYTKDDKTVHQITTKIAGLDVTLEANSQEDALKLKQELDTIQFKVETPLSEEDKAHNTECLNKILATTNNKEAIDVVIKVLKNANYVNHNLPETKALVQKLLLTRDADIVRSLVKTDGNVDNTLFENDPVAFKTLAAMFKEIRDLENQGVKLSPEQIALKGVLDDAMNNKTFIDGEYIAFDDTGLYQCGSWSNNLQLGKDFEAAWYSAKSAEEKQAVIEKFLNDPRVKEDKNFLLYLVDSDNSNDNIDRPFNDATPAQQKAIIELIKDNARALARVDLSDVPAGTTDAEKAAAKAVKDAYVAKAKALFQYDTPAEGTKLDPANARYLRTILDKIDSISTKGSEEGAVDPDKAVIDEILGQFFVTTGEGENAVTTIKDFRRFTYEEMKGLADAVSRYGTDAQKTALANMITIEDMEDGQFVRAIEASALNTNTRTKYAEFVDGMTTKEEVLEFIDKMEYPSSHIPFDKIVEKFGDEPEVLNKILKHISVNNVMSDETRKKLVAYLVDNENNVTIPDNVSAYTLYNLLPTEKAASGSGESATPEVKMDAKEQALFNKLVTLLDKNNLYELSIMHKRAGLTTDLQAAVINRVNTLAEENKTDAGFMVSLKNNFPDIALNKLLEQAPSEITSLDDDDDDDIANIKDFVTSRIKVDENPTDEQVQMAFTNGWLTAETADTETQKTGKEIKGALYQWGTGDNFWSISKDETKINKDTIIDVLDGYNNAKDAGDTEGFIECMTSDGVPKAIVNRYIKALMRKAVDLGLQNSTEFNNLKTFFDNTEVGPNDGDDLVTGIFRGSAHDNSGTSEYTTDKAKTLDKYITALLNKVKLWTGRA